MSSSTLTKRELREQRRAERQAAEAAEAAARPPPPPALPARRRRRRSPPCSSSSRVAVSSSGGTQATPATPAKSTLFAGIPEHNGVLGDPKAPVTVTEYLDLQCPICAEASKTDAADAGQRLRPHRQGQAAGAHAALHRRRTPSRAARVAAGAQQQGQLWPFLEAFYAAQGQENSGYVTDGFLRSRGHGRRRRRRQGAGRRRRSRRGACERADAEANAAPASTRRRPSRSPRDGKTTVIGSGVLDATPRSQKALR